MADSVDTRERPRAPFRTVAFGGYERADVDAYFLQVAQTAKHDRDEIETLKRFLDELKAELEAARQESELNEAQRQREIDEAAQERRALRDDLDRARLELSTWDEKFAAAQEERESYRRLAERLSTEEHQAREVLRAATRTADEIKKEAQSEAEELVARAEESAKHIEADARRRVEEIRREYERIRREYDDFLKQARDVADALTRRIEDARLKWPS